MIKTKEDYKNYLRADRKALGRSNSSIKDQVFRFFVPDYIYNFQYILRKVEYLKNIKGKNILLNIIYIYYRLKFKKLSLRLGFTIPPNVFGPGLAIVHYGTIVVNQNAKVGANCRIHPCTNIGASGGDIKAPRIGNNVYIAPGAKIFGDIDIANNLVIGANAVVNKSFDEENIMIAGIPARRIKEANINYFIKNI
jgi:serine O-acetyltransferase